MRRTQTMYLMNDSGEVIKQWPCHDDFVPGYNEYGEPRESLPNGTYPHCWAEITYGAYGPSYGNFYITTGDERGRDIHGGGAGCSNPYANFHEWIPTYGCLRMQNYDGCQLSAIIISDGNDMLLEVVDK